MYQDKDVADIYSDYINPENVKISTKAMSIHHITPDMVKNSSIFEESDIVRNFISFNDSKNILVAHNISFDMKMINREGIVWLGPTICTLRCARHIFKDLESYSLQYLRYELGLYKEEQDFLASLDSCKNLQPHDAMFDVLIMRLLLKRLLQDVNGSVSKLVELTNTPVFIGKIRFGKHSGEKLVDIDPSYLRWLLSNHNDLDNDLKYSIIKVLEG
jgi:DNA polymerase-3 subunit epsilon/exodeoxyribonuclease X